MSFVFLVVFLRTCGEFMDVRRLVHTRVILNTQIQLLRSLPTSVTIHLHSGPAEIIADRHVILHLFLILQHPVKSTTILRSFSLSISSPYRPFPWSSLGRHSVAVANGLPPPAAQKSRRRAARQRIAFRY